jgi:hypothetical protein
VHKFNGIKRESNQQLCTKETVLDREILRENGVSGV